MSSIFSLLSRVHNSHCVLKLQTDKWIFGIYDLHWLLSTSKLIIAPRQIMSSNFNFNVGIFTSVDSNGSSSPNLFAIILNCTVQMWLWKNFSFQISEKNPSSIKNFGIWLRYNSRSGTHNMYREYRDITVCGAVTQCCKYSLKFLFVLNFSFT